MEGAGVHGGGDQRAEKAIKEVCLSISTPLSTKNDPSLRWTGLLAEAFLNPHGCHLISWMTGQFLSVLEQLVNRLQSHLCVFGRTFSV